MTTCLVTKKSFPNPVTKSFFFAFFKFHSLAPVFNSVIYLELIFVYGAGLRWFGLLGFLVHVDVWFFQHVSGEGDYLFPIELFWCLC